MYYWIAVYFTGLHPELVTMQVQQVTHRHPGAGSDSGHKLSLFVGCLPLGPLEAVQGGREVVQQTLFLYLSLPLKTRRIKMLTERTTKNVEVWETNSVVNRY